MNSQNEVAPALLGSTLLASEEHRESRRPTPASSGNRSIDQEVLDGGFRYGEITAIAGAKGSGKTTLVYQAIASHLTAHKEAKTEVALIATTEPSLAQLRDILIARISKHNQGHEFHESGYVYRKQPFTAQPTHDISNTVLSMLECVQIYRVFDFPGVVEAITEFSTRLEEKDRCDRAEMSMEGNNRKQNVTDSEDGAEDEALSKTDGNCQNITDVASDQVTAAAGSPGSMIVVDNIANVVGSMITRSQVQGHAMLASLMRTLHLLTRSRHLCTLIVNGAVGLHPQNPQYHRRADDHVSVFSSTPGKPALGKHFTYLVDTSIYLSTLPRTNEDADIIYGDPRGTRRAKVVSVIEVIKDRYGSREGGWSPFAIIAGTEVRSVQL
ncbi:MAG: hypothetical protein Q9219_003894 [cf. Caloplaca sp. 3 TL-2023]